MSRRRRPGDVSTVGQNVLACCYAVIGLSSLGLAVLKWTAARIDRAVTLPVTSRRVAR